jgi:lipoprotein NlpI
MRVSSMILLTTLLGSSAMLQGQTRDENWKRCTDSSLDLSIGGCTALIQSGQETDTNMAIAFTNRGNDYRHKGEYDRAIQDFDQALKLNPNYINALVRRGDAYSSKHDYDHAVQDFDQALKIDPNSAPAFNDRGMMYADKGEFDRAIQDYDQALKAKPDYAWAFNNRGNAYSDLRDYAQAIKDYNETLRLNPDNSSAFNNRGNAYLRMGEFERSIPDFDQSLKLSPTFLNAFRGRAAAYFYLGQFAAAQPDFANAVKSTPTDAYSVLWLYVSESRAGQDARSVLEMDTAQIDRTAWPGQLVDLFLGKATPEAILAAASDPSPHKNQSQLCEADFFLGEHALLDGKRTEARRLFQQAIDTGATWELQFAGAQTELKRLPAISAKTSR